MRKISFHSGIRTPERQTSFVYSVAINTPKAVCRIQKNENLNTLHVCSCSPKSDTPRFFSSQPHLFEHAFPCSTVRRITLVYSHPYLFEHIFSLFQCTRKRRLYSINIYITYRLQLPLDFPTSSTISSTPQATERWEFKFVTSGKTYTTNFWLAQTNKYGGR